MGKFVLFFFFFFFFFSETCVIFMLFFIYINFFIPEYLTDMCLLCANVGPVRPMDYVRNRHHPRLGVALVSAGGPTVVGEPPTGEAERVLRQVERNFTSLTHTIPMAEIEDLPVSMQPHVVGAPRTWVRLFWRLENIVDHYNRAHRA
jgi:hypothetical protein